MDRAVRIPLVAACVAALLGCKAFDAELLERSERGASAGSVRDAGPDAAESCAASVERCNGVDDDCDGMLDEGAESDCAAGNAVGACVPGGTCVLASCEDGWADCNGETEDGCEQAKAGVACGKCGRVCAPGETGMPDDLDGGAGDDDAGTDEGACSPAPEQCNGADDDCDEWVDEAGACTVQMCTASAPSYRGASCDACACTSCTLNVAQCQNHPDPDWAARCRALVECFVVHDALGECGTNADCYMNNMGPCAAEVNLAAGGSSGTDTSRTSAGCAAGSPPSAPCAAATNYRDQCVRSSCASACGN